MKRIILFFLMFVLFASTNSIGGQNDNQDDLLSKAEAGDLMAMLGVGDHYRYGTDKDYPKAIFWYEKAAKLGHARGLLEMAYCYENGYGVKQDYKKAMSWFEKAARTDDSGQALLCIGLMNYRGQGADVNKKEVKSYFQRAANVGNKSAQKWLEKINEEESIAESQRQNRIIKDAEGFEWITALEETISVENKFGNKKEKLDPSLQKDSNNDRQPIFCGVDIKIPQINSVNKNIFAIVIGCEMYTDETSVPYAENDAKVFKEYCLQTLGVSEKHIRYIANAGYNDMRKAVKWLRLGLEAYGGEGNVIFYYAGHGIPDESQKTAYLLPVDGIGSDVESGYSLEKLYQALGDMPAKSIIVFLDACFSGAKRDGGMMASARGVAIKTKAEEPKGKMVVFSAAQDDETAYPYKSQQHGMLTYYLLRKLQETKGDVTLGELADYITREVKRQCFDENSRSQTPSVKASASFAESWRNLKLK